MMHKKMIHDIRYVGKAGELNFSKEPYMYQDTDLFNYNIEYDLNYFPSGKGGRVKRFKQWPQVNTLTLGVINRVDVRELVSKLERHFQADINAKTPAKLFINGSYTECYIVSSVKTYFNRFLGINFITFEILREKPVWTSEEEYAYQKADLETNPYDLNLYKPPYDFSQLEFTQPAKSLEEANLIKNGWDDFEPNGSGKNYVKNWDFSEGTNHWTGSNALTVSESNGVLLGDVSRENTVIPYSNVSQEISLPSTETIKIRMKVKSNTGSFRFYINGNKNKQYYEYNNSGEFEVYEIERKVVSEDSLSIYFYPNRDPRLTKIGDKIWIDWIQITPIDNQHLVVEKTPLENGLTRIQTWGGNKRGKYWILGIPIKKDEIYTDSIYVHNLGSDLVISTNTSWEFKTVKKNEKGFFKSSKPSIVDGGTNFSFKTKNINDNLDFIASDPVIVEDDGSMIYDIHEYEDKYRIRTMNSHSRTKMTLPAKTSIFKNEQYTHSIYAENKGDQDVLLQSEEGTYLEDPVIEIKPDEKGTFKYTGTVAEDKLYTNIEFATKEASDEIDLVLAKPAIRYGDRPFEWPPEEEIIPLRLPTHTPFWITADDSVKYISNNSIGDTLAKITIFGPIKNPTLYIGSNTYRVYEELLQNERIEIDQRAKTVTKITSSGDKVNVFHLRDKEHSVFKPIPEGENTVTQNDDFSYTIVLYHERNEPSWS